MKKVRIAHLTTTDVTLRFLLLPQLKALKSLGYEVVAISSRGRWTDELADEGIEHIDWPHATRAWNPLADVRAAWALRRIFSEQRFDVVHTHNPKPGFIGRIAARLTGTPCVVNTVHGLYATPSDRVAKKAPVLGMERVAAKFSDLELYQSREDFDWARRIRLAHPSKTRLLGNGIDVGHFDPTLVDKEEIARLRDELSIPADAVVVGSVGRLVAEKGYRELLAVAKRVTSLRGDVRFLLAGDLDPDKADSLDRSDIASNDSVVFAGWRSDIREILAAIDIFVLPSWREGVPRSAIEAAAMSKPLILTNIRGCREVGRDGREGLLVEPRDEAALERAITRLIEDPALRDRLGAAARDRAVERFDERRVIALVQSEYESLLKRKGVIGTASDQVMIRRAVPHDARRIAQLHISGLPNAFLPRLGHRFLTTMYRGLIAYPESVVTVADNDGGVVGFCAGVTSVGAFYRWFLLRRGLQAFVSAAPRLVLPGVIRKALETKRYPKVSDGVSAELLAIAIDERHTGEGLGKRLALPFLSELADRGVSAAKVVVAAENGRANRFYERLGFEHERTITLHGSSPSNVWVICTSRSLSQ